MGRIHPPLGSPAEPRGPADYSRTGFFSCWQPFTTRCEESFFLRRCRVLCCFLSSLISVASWTTIYWIFPRVSCVMLSCVSIFFSSVFSGVAFAEVVDMDLLSKIKPGAQVQIIEEMKRAMM